MTTQFFFLISLLLRTRGTWGEHGGRRRLGERMRRKRSTMDFRGDCFLWVPLYLICLVHHSTLFTFAVFVLLFSLRLRSIQVERENAYNQSCNFRIPSEQLAQLWHLLRLSIIIIYQLLSDSPGNEYHSACTRALVLFKPGLGFFSIVNTRAFKIPIKSA